jgi:hypothetical protein
VLDPKTGLVTRSGWQVPYDVIKDACKHTGTPDEDEWPAYFKERAVNAPQESGVPFDTREGVLYHGSVGREFSSTSGIGAQGVRELGQMGKDVGESGGTRYGPAAAGVVALRALRVSRIWPLHHPFPKYLGGAVDQTLTKMPRKLHERFHAALDKWKCGKYARSKGADHFKDINKQEVIKDLREFYQSGEGGIFAEYLSDFEQAVKESGF